MVTMTCIVYHSYGWHTDNGQFHSWVKRLVGEENSLSKKIAYSHVNLWLMSSLLGLKLSIFQSYNKKVNIISPCCNELFFYCVMLIDIFVILLFFLSACTYTCEITPPFFSLSLFYFHLFCFTLWKLLLNEILRYTIASCICGVEWDHVVFVAWADS